VRGKRLRPLAVLAGQPLAIEGFGDVPPITKFIDKPLPILSTAFGIFIPKEGTPKEVFATFDVIWKNVIPNSPELKGYALKKGALFAPSSGQTARDRVWPEIQADAWSFQAAGRAKVHPDKLGIPKP